MKTKNVQKLREQLVQSIRGGQAFSTIDQVIKKMPFVKAGIVPPGLPYSFYQQLYHIWFSQHDIIDYCLNEKYEAPDWPHDYWPQKSAPLHEEEWDELVDNFFTERKEFCDFILDPANDLFEPFSANPDHNLLREIQLVIEHSAYHTGQLYIIDRLLK